MEMVILLAGEGTRLGNLTKDIPKPMVDVNGKPFLYYLLKLMKNQGFSDFLFICSYRHKVIQDYFKEGGAFGVKIRYSIQDRPYGTGGNLVTALDEIRGEKFMLVNGDTIFNINLKEFVKKSIKKNAKNSIALKKVPESNSSGVVEVDEDERVISFSEKKQAKAEVLINCGLYLLDKSDFKSYPKNNFISLEREIFPKLNIFGFEMKGEFIDIGTLDSYKEFCNNFNKYIKNNQIK